MGFLKCNSGISLNPANKNAFTILFILHCIRALIPLKQIKPKVTFLLKAVLILHLLKVLCYLQFLKNTKFVRIVLSHI